jgi:ribose transport system substrate-binding protein
MHRSDPRPRRRLGAALAGVCLAGLALAGCSTVGTTDSSAGPATSGGANASDPAVVDATAYLDTGYAGDFDQPPTEGPAAQSGKDVWFISCGQAYVACVQMSDSFSAAGAELGWNVTVQDGKADPSNAAAIIRQAIAAGVDGVGLATYDCPGIRSALVDAKAAGLPVVNFGSIDCDSAIFDGKPGDGLFAASVNLRGSTDQAEFFENWARARAKYVIGTSQGDANLLWVTEQSQAEQQAQGEAFKDEIATCTSCVLTEVPFTFAQVPNPATQQWQTAIQAHPDANAVIEGIDALMPLGLSTAITQSGRTGMMVGGGEGFPANFDLIRDGVQTFSVAIPYGWVMYGLADTLNRVFAGDDPSSFPSEGAGWQFIDADHNLPAAGESYEPSYDYRADYTALWGATG